MNFDELICEFVHGFETKSCVTEHMSENSNTQYTQYTQNKKKKKKRKNPEKKATIFNEDITLHYKTTAKKHFMKQYISFT